MKSYKVLIDVFHTNNHVETKTVTIEAGNKKLATLRALSEISKRPEFANLYKTVKGIEEVG